MSSAAALSLSEYLGTQQQKIDHELKRLVPSGTMPPETIHRAVLYSLLAGGKRIRPILCIEAARAVRAEGEGLVQAACSLEMIHTYSLIHDDLPALDNDDFRRGKPTCHKVFGDAMAILAGDALLTMAFETLASLPHCPPARVVRLVAELARAAGTVGGMIGGQVADIEGERQTPTEELLESIHRAKTGALLRASVRMGAIFAGASDDELQALSSYGEHVGLAFQIVDDILDVEESSDVLGKTAGKDAHQQKITFPAVYGLDVSRQMAKNECERASNVLDRFGDQALRLREIAAMIVSRKS
jgi:geranylgeranyl diphosphate synthase type II